MTVYFTPPITPTVTAGSYTNGDSVGGVISVGNIPEQGMIMSVVIQDDADQGNAFQLFFFESEPTGVADNAAFDLSDADMGLCVGAVSLDTWFDATSSQVLSVSDIGLPYRAMSRTLYMMIKLNDGSAPTYAATDDLHIRLGIVY